MGIDNYGVVSTETKPLKKRNLKLIQTTIKKSALNQVHLKFHTQTATTTTAACKEPGENTAEIVSVRMRPIN